MIVNQNHSLRNIEIVINQKYYLNICNYEVLFNCIEKQR